MAAVSACAQARNVAGGTAAAQGHPKNATASVSAQALEQARVLHAREEPPFGRPDAVIDLATPQGIALVQGGWRYREARLVTTDAHLVGPDLRASGAAIKALDLDTQAGASGFDDSRWEKVPPEGLLTRRGPGHVSFGWYRLSLVLPARVGDLDVSGSTIAFEIVVDDYAEVWVDGKLTRTLGQRGGALIAGFNAPNRVILTRNAKPGQRIQIAVLGINGPISARPENFLWVRSATLDVYAPRRVPEQNAGQIVRLDAALAAIVPATARIEQLATGFEFTEGPVWNEGGLLFSDPNANTIYRYEPEGRLSVFRVKSGYSGTDIGRYHQPGSNGLAIDRQGRLTIDQHGNRRVIRVERTGAVTVLADRYQGKRLNSPNDLVYRSDGTLYFTDPPFGLPKVFDDPGKELEFSGVYKVDDHGELQLLVKDLTGPNGIAFSPDERFLYVGNWDPKRKVVMRYDVRRDGSLGEGSVFYDVTAMPGEEAIDGIEVDERGNLYVSAPAGVHIVSPEGKHIGTLAVNEQPANFAWGDDGHSLYMTARTGLYRVRLSVSGAHFGS
jgi:gluconolactonase